MIFDIKNLLLLYVSKTHYRISTQKDKGILKMKKRLLCIVFALLTCIMLFSGCSDKEKEQDGSEADASKTEEKEYLVPHLGKGKDEYRGKTLRVLATWEQKNFGTEQITPSEMSGEPVNDAFRTRNQMLEQEYGFKIEGEFTPS